MIVDSHKLVGYGCARERDALLALLEWGALVRHRSPKAGITSASHEKSWLFDGGLYCTGSFNLTRNSVTSCEEALMSTTQYEAVLASQQHFGTIWEKAAILDLASLKEMDEKARARRSASKSRSSASEDGGE